MFGKAEAKQLQRDYIPNGKSLTREEFSKLKFRKTYSFEVYQCGVPTRMIPNPVLSTAVR